MLSHAVALLALGCLIAFYAASKVGSWVQLSRFSKANGCKPVRQLPQSERILGYALYRADTAAAKAKASLPTGLQRFKDFGNTWSGNLLGQYFIATIEPENVKALLATQFDHFSLQERYSNFGPLVGRGIFTTDGAQWKHSRALVRPNFNKEQFASLDIFTVHINHLIDRIPKNGSTVDLQPLFFQLTLDTTTEFLFNESVNILQSEPGSLQQEFATAFDYAQSELNVRERMGLFRMFYRNPRFDEACKTVHEFVDKLVYKALQMRKARDADGKGEERYAFLNELARATKDPIQIRSEALNILIAGRDTTAGLLSNVFHVLARRPDVWNKLRLEVDSLGAKELGYDTLRNLTYLRYVLNEVMGSLRLYPSVPSNARFANRDTTIPLGGGPDGLSPVVVPKGTPVTYSTYSMHRRRDFFGEDAEEFRPERWESLRVGWEYLPFNGGPRICIGQQFALTQAGYTIVKFVQAFESMESRDITEWREGWKVTLASANGTKVAMTPRN